MEAWLGMLLDALSLPKFGLSTVFVVAFVSATLLPLGSEPAVFGLVKLNPELFWPAILVATADTDDRVVPGHSFKYTAALQAADIGDKPHLARIETRAGHGSGKPTDKVIEEAADNWAFAAKWTGLQVKPVQ